MLSSVAVNATVRPSIDETNKHALITLVALGAHFAFGTTRALERRADVRLGKALAAASVLAAGGAVWVGALVEALVEVDEAVRVRGQLNVTATATKRKTTIDQRGKQKASRKETTRTN